MEETQYTHSNIIFHSSFKCKKKLLLELLLQLLKYSGFQTLLYNPGGQWSGGGKGGGKEAQVCVEVEWPEIEVESAEQEARADLTETGEH